MRSVLHPDFRTDFAGLPPVVQQQARVACERFKADPYQQGLRFKKLPPHDDVWSVRVNANYRAVGSRKEDVILWLFIGSHADHDKLLRRLRR